MESPTTSVALLCVVVIAVVYAAELVLASSNSGFGVGSTPAWGLDAASAEHKEEIAVIARRAGIQLDTRDSIDVVADLRNEGIDAVRAVMLGGIVSRPAAIDKSAGTLMPLGGVHATYRVV